jgi:hypothetical protein
MKYSFSILLFILLFFSSLSAQDNRLRIVILDFKISGNLINEINLGFEVAKNLEIGFLNANCFSVMERKNNLEILKEIEFQSYFEKFLDDKTKTKLLIAGAQFVVLGEVVGNKTNIKISAKIVEVSTNKIIAETFITLNSSYDNIDKLLNLYLNYLFD